MLDGIKNAMKGAATKAATAVGKKIADTDWGKNKLKEEMAKMPIPPQAKAMFTKLIDNNPELLMKIAEEIQSEVSKGRNQMQASQSIMMKYRNELQKAMAN